MKVVFDRVKCLFVYESLNLGIIISVPNEVDLTDLTPTLDFKGKSIKYATDHDENLPEFNEYIEDTSVDFKFPNIVAFRIYNSDESRYREYRILVDFKDIITFDSKSDTIDPGKVVSLYNVYDNVTGFTYHGNYPLSTFISPSEVKVIKSPESDPVNYFTDIRLLEDNPDDDDKIINTGERGKMHVTLHFPGSFKGDSIGFSEYIIDVSFTAMLDSYATPNIRNDFGGLENLYFFIYTTSKIELVAKVLVTNK